MQKIKSLLEHKIDWQKSENNEFMFTTEFEGKPFKLRLNNFPEEPLCTVIFENVEQDLDDLGKKWTLPKHRKE